MIETLLDFLFNTSEYRKEHNLGFIVVDKDNKELCNSRETKTLEEWMTNPVVNMAVTKSDRTESDYIITVEELTWNEDEDSADTETI